MVNVPAPTGPVIALAPMPAAMPVPAAPRISPPALTVIPPPKLLVAEESWSKPLPVLVIEAPAPLMSDATLRVAWRSV